MATRRTILAWLAVVPAALCLPWTRAEPRKVEPKLKYRLHQNEHLTGGEVHFQEGDVWCDCTFDHVRIYPASRVSYFRCRFIQCVWWVDSEPWDVFVFDCLEETP